MYPDRSIAAAALALLAAIPASPVLADETDSEAEAIVVTATRQATRASELLSDVSVIERADIEKAGSLETLGELLSREGGVEFSSLGAPGSASSIYIRGANAGHTLLLIDGVRVGSATMGAPTFSALPLAQIERIEILKGSASSLYGSDAIGGVIHVITRKGGGPAQLSADASIGSYGTREANASVSGQANALHYSLNLGTVSSDGFNSINNAANPYYNADEDGFRRQSATAQVSVDLAPGHELGAQVFYSRNRNDYDGYYYDAMWNPVAAYDFHAQTTVESYAVYAKNRFTANWTSLVRIGRSIDDSQDHDSPTTRSDFRTHQDQLVWQNDIRLPVGSLLLAAETLTQEIDSSATFTENKRTINSLLAGWTGNLGSHRLQLNVRNDHNSQFGTETTGSAAYGYQIDDAWRARLALSTGFKAPSFNDLYFPDDPALGGGNPNLKPESSFNREIGLNYEKGPASASLTLYRNEIEDLIQWAADYPSDDYSPWHPMNVSQARLEGLTLNGRYQWRDVTLRGSFDLQNNKDETTGKYLVLRARQHGTLGFDHVLGRLSWGGEVLASGARYNDPANMEKLGGYATVSLYADYRLDHGLTLFAKAGNIFDKKYELREDYSTAGRTFFIGLRYQPKLSN